MNFNVQTIKSAARVLIVGGASKHDDYRIIVAAQPKPELSRSVVDEVEVHSVLGVPGEDNEPKNYTSVMLTKWVYLVGPRRHGR